MRIPKVQLLAQDIPKITGGTCSLITWCLVLVSPRSQVYLQFDQGEGK